MSRKQRSDLIDITGQRFGRVMVLTQMGSTVVGHCDCGSLRCYRSRNLREGVARSCGCGRDIANRRKAEAAPLTTLADLAARIAPSSNGCWIWTGMMDRHGYGVVRVRKSADNNRLYRAHRAVYEFMVGPPPTDLVSDHLCRVRACVNPDHIRFCTIGENVMAEGSRSPSRLAYDAKRGQ